MPHKKTKLRADKVSTMPMPSLPNLPNLGRAQDALAAVRQILHGLHPAERSLVLVSAQLGLVDLETKPSKSTKPAGGR